MTKLSIEFDSDELQKIELIRKHTGIKAVTEIIRYLITEAAHP